MRVSSQHQRAFTVLESEGARASELAYHALLAGEVEAAYHASVQAGVEAVAVFAVADAIGHYEQARALLKAPNWKPEVSAHWDGSNCLAETLKRQYAVWKRPWRCMRSRASSHSLREICHFLPLSLVLHLPNP
jgi:hypothetical protein